MNWYRTRTINGEDERPLAQQAPRDDDTWLPMPGMLVMAGEDPALPWELAEGQEQYFAAGLKKELISEASHWILTHCPEESNRYIGEFLDSILGTL